MMKFTVFLLGLAVTNTLVGCKRTCVKGNVEACQERCEGGEAESCRVLGAMYADGISVEKDLDRAIVIFRKGCELKDPASCFEVGRAEVDHGDFDGGMSILDGACGAGEGRACDVLSVVWMRARPLNAQKAAEYSRKACKLGDSDACPEKLVVEACANRLNVDACDLFAEVFPEVVIPAPPVPDPKASPDDQYKLWLSPLLLELAGRSQQMDRLFQEKRGLGALLLQPGTPNNEDWKKRAHRVMAKTCALKDKLAKPPSGTVPHELLSVTQKAAEGASYVCGLGPRFDKYASGDDHQGEAVATKVEEVAQNLAAAAGALK